MAIAKRVFLFFFVNILILLTLTVLMNVAAAFGFRISPTGYGPLMAWALAWGMGGSLISLLMSKTIAKWSMGVKVIEPDASTPELRSLVAQVQSLAQRAGLPSTPEVGIYESPEVNAFATGPSKGNALVAVSTGLLRRLSRDEREAVLGHEISHVANGDMVTMTLLQGVVNAFVLFFARVIATLAGGAVGGRNRWVVEFVVMVTLQIALGLLGTIVVSFYSRRREFRADAGGATLAGRQKMIAALQALGRTRELVAPAEGAFAALKIAGPNGFASFFMSHPPLEERIAALERSAPGRTI